jgi:HK97 family phage major capsid protein
VPVTELPAPSLGASITPEQWATFILERLALSSVVLRSGARRITTTADTLHVPRFTSAATAGWYAELVEIAEGAPTGDDIKLVMHKVATLAKLSNEVVADATPGSVNAIGDQMVAAVALEVDRAIFVGGGAAVQQPTGILGQITQGEIGPVASYDTIVKAKGQVAQWGGIPDSLYLNPADWNALELLKDTTGRPLVQPDVAQGAAPQFAGLGVYPTPALAAATAIVAQADEIVVGVRNDPTVALSSEALFTADGTAARVVARMDSALNDSRGLCKITATIAAAEQEEGKAPARKR